MAQLHDIDRFTTPPDIADVEALAREAMAFVPPELRRWAAEVIVKVEDFPDEDTMDEMGLETPFDLLGLYRGVDLMRKSVLDSPQEVDIIHIYRRPILDYWCETGEDLRDLVRHVIVHEIGHHFGFSDEEMERIEQGVSPR
ncbi:metallopeptidase family protein [Ferruginivarius sediminum]|jgi:predicted Zn-dependent protease with MMP-like domain|uniref:Acetylglutamate kinase n=1 Tax=Ferruginivarius sediminum TaxID=2661937 RepID=A0A369T4F0_9PROT|nr:metallopeptidase family protein [Ferruginivarius sediminum]RDD60221.1 acetylglutamate kinase [Ferruginivarius sediminum]